MTVNNIFGDTFVAFVDISGFKNKLNDGVEGAEQILKEFYESGYEILKQPENKNILGFFVSDCAILFPNPERLSIRHDIYRDFNLLLSVIKELNKKMLRKSIMLTCSIAYGHFTYTNYIEFDGISQNPILGNGYLKTYLDHEKENPKLQPGECRILIDKDLLEKLELTSFAIEKYKDVFAEFGHLKEKNENYYYYYWMVNDSDYIENIEQGYKNANECRYYKIEKMLKTSVGKRNRVNNQ